MVPLLLCSQAFNASNDCLCRNKNETVSQNYRRLGLTARLNNSTGGTEKSIKILGLDDPQTLPTDTTNKLDIVSQPPENLSPGEVEVERDPKTGKILRILNESSESKANDNPLDDPLNELEDSDAEEWNGFAMVPEGKESDNPVIRQLEEAARNGARKAPRKQSQKEEEWIERLVEKYGDDYVGMMRDRKLNPMQQSEGDIRRRVRRWKEVHGVE